jgi:hypothetical protein
MQAYLLSSFFSYLLSQISEWLSFHAPPFIFLRNCKYTHWNCKSNDIHVTGSAGLYGCETSRLPQFSDKLLPDGGEAVSLKRRRRFTPQKYFLVLISVGGWPNYTEIVRLEGLNTFKNFNDLIVNRTLNRPARSIVPQPTMLLRISVNGYCFLKDLQQNENTKQTVISKTLL